MRENRIFGMGLLCLTLLFILTFTFFDQIELAKGVMINMMGKGDISLQKFRNYGTGNPGIENCSRDPGCINAYIPEYICIPPNTGVTWVNVGDIYRTATSGDEIKGPSEEFDSGIVEPDENFTHIFTQNGKVTYFDTQYSTSPGTIEVDENCTIPIIKHSFNEDEEESFGGYNSSNIDYITYTNDTSGIQILYPVGWNKTNANSYGDDIHVLSLDRSKGSGDFDIWLKDRGNETLEQIPNATADCEKYNAEEVKVIKIDNNATVAGYPAFSIVCTYEDDGIGGRDDKREVIVWHSIINDKIIKIEYDDTLKRFPVYLSSVERMINSLKFPN